MVDLLPKCLFTFIFIIRDFDSIEKHKGEALNEEGKPAREREDEIRLVAKSNLHLMYNVQ